MLWQIIYTCEHPNTPKIPLSIINRYHMALQQSSFLNKKLKVLNLILEMKSCISVVYTIGLFSRQILQCPSLLFMIITSSLSLINISANSFFPKPIYDRWNLNVSHGQIKVINLQQHVHICPSKPQHTSEDFFFVTFHEVPDSYCSIIRTGGKFTIRRAKTISEKQRKQNISLEIY